MTDRAQNIRRQILQLVKEYYDDAFISEKFIPGSIKWKYNGMVVDF